MKRLLRLLFLRLLALLARPFVRRSPDSITSVLYLKPDHLGDLLLATPVLAALRQRLPDARITALVGPWSRMVLQRNPNIDTLLTCPFPGFERRPVEQVRRTTGGRFADRLFHLAKPYLLLIHYAQLLRGGRYDLAIVGRDDHWWGAALALLAGVPWRMGYDLPECRPFLTQALPWDPREHVTAQGLALVAAIDGSSGAAGPRQFAARFEPAPEDMQWAAQWIAAHELAGAPLVVLHPGTGGPAKLWFAERWAALADTLAAAGARLVLTGGPDERQLVESVAAGMRSPALSLAGQTSVGQLAALLGGATLVLGVDSGPMHLAAAQGARTLHLYGPGDAGRFGPWGDPARHVVLRVDLWCSPCGEFAACPRGLAQPECMDRIAVAAVAERALTMLAAAPAPVSAGRLPDEEHSAS